MPLWNAVCEVHDKFKEAQITRLLNNVTDNTGKGKTGKNNAGRDNTDRYLLAHPESPLPVLKRADFVGSTKQMLKWVENFPSATATLYIATEEGLLYNMRQYMKRNTAELVQQAQQGKGFIIDYLADNTIEKAVKPIKRMLEFNKLQTQKSTADRETRTPDSILTRYG